LFFEEEKKRSKPTKALKKMIYVRDKGFCRMCNEKVDPFNFEVGHNIAHSKGGKLDLQNAILLCSLCNKSMRTLTLKQARKALGVKSPEDESKKILNKLSMRELKFLAKNHRIKLKSKVEEGFLSSTIIAPSKRQYVNALAKDLTFEQIEKEIKNVPKPEPKKKTRKKKSSSWF
jgi:HNH endonuclease